VIDMIVPPDLNQARVNKCLIALVNRKIVTKDNSTVGERTYLLIRRNTECRYFTKGTVLYYWQGLAT
jgi:DASH complex subunit DAM1